MSETEWAGGAGKRLGRHGGQTTHSLENKDVDLQILFHMKREDATGI